MTIAELERAINSKQRVRKIEQQERATFDYILAGLVGKRLAQLYSNSEVIPPINEVYSTLFNDSAISETIAENKAKLSALRIKQFAAAHNKKFKETQGG